MGTGILRGDESGTGQVIAASHSQCGVDRSQRGGDEQHDDGEDHAGNIAADNIALAECDRVSGQPHGLVSNIRDGQQTVEGQDHGQDDGGGDHQDANGDAAGVSDGQGSIDTDVELIAAELLIQQLLNGISKRNQAFHQDLHHLRGQDHGSSGVHSNGHNAGNIVAAQDAEHSAKDSADHQRLAEDAELFLDALGVSLQLVQAGDVVVNFVQQVSQRCPADAVGGGEGNAGQAELFLNDRLGPVGQLEGNDSADSTADQADDGAAGSIIADSSAEDEVVVAPEVDHDAVGSLQNQHQDVDAQDDEYDHSGQGVSPGSGGTGRPTHIHDVGMQAKAGDHVLHAGANLCNKGVDDQVDTAEANTGGDAALQQGADLNTQTNTDNEHDDGHHAHGTQTADPVQGVNNNLHFITPPVL